MHERRDQPLLWAANRAFATSPAICATAVTRKTRIGKTLARAGRSMKQILLSLVQVPVILYF
jgi:hypothetical protein